jgi:hypothetical protein
MFIDGVKITTKVLFAPRQRPAGAASKHTNTHSHGRVIDGAITILRHLLFRILLHIFSPLKCDNCMQCAAVHTDAAAETLEIAAA